MLQYFCVLVSLYTLEQSPVLKVENESLFFKAGIYTAEIHPYAYGEKTKFKYISRIRDSVFDNYEDYDLSQAFYTQQGFSFQCSTDAATLAKLETNPNLKKVLGPFWGDDQSQTPVTVDASTVFVGVHTSYEFDHGKHSKNAILESFNKVKEVSGSQSVLLSHLPETDAGYYFTKNDVNHFVYSASGGNRLQFPNAKTIVMTGGYVEACFCEGLRDVIHGIPEKNSARVILPLESIFYHQFDSIAPEHILNAFQVNFMGISDQLSIPSGYFCPGQNSQRPINTSLRSDGLTLSISIHYAGASEKKWIGNVGTGSKKVELILVSNSHLSQYLK